MTKNKKLFGDVLTIVDRYGKPLFRILHKTSLENYSIRILQNCSYGGAGDILKIDTSIGFRRPNRATLHQLLTDTFSHTPYIHSARSLSDLIELSTLTNEDVDQFFKEIDQALTDAAATYSNHSPLPPQPQSGQCQPLGPGVGCTPTGVIIPIVPAVPTYKAVNYPAVFADAARYMLEGISGGIVEPTGLTGTLYETRLNTLKEDEPPKPATSRSGGCTCGVWASGGNHSSWCDKGKS